MFDFSPVRTFKKETLIGLWWIPGREHKCYGTLSFDIDGEQKLRIMGYLEGEFPGYLAEYKVIHGICKVEKETRMVTLFHVWVTSSPVLMPNESSLSETVVSFDDLWIGNCHYDCKENVCFESFIFGLNNLENWLDQRQIFSNNFDHGLKKISAGMEIPDPIPVFSDEYVSISIDYWRQAPGIGTGQTECTMRCRPLICIKANSETLQYYGDKASYSFYTSWIFQLFELFTEGHTFVFGLHGYGPVTENKINMRIQSEILFARDITMKQRKEISPIEILFPFKKIKECLLELSGNFQKNYEKMGSILEVLCSSLCTSSYNLYSLPNLLFSLEGIQQLFYHSLGEKDSPVHKEKYEAFDKQRRAVIEKCGDDDDLKSFVKKEICWRATFRDRLHGMLSDVCSIFQLLNKDTCDMIADDLKKLRNAGAHSDSREQKNLNIHLLLRKIHFVQFLHIALILKSCGLPEEVIKDCFDNSYPREFQEMSEELKKHYSETAEGTNE